MRKKVIITIIILVVCILLIVLKYLIPNHDLFNYNLMEILTTVVVSFGIYYLTKINDDIKSKNKKTQDVIELLRNKFNDVFNQPIDPKNKQQYLHSFKYIDNKIAVLEKLSTHLKCAEDIKELKNEKGKLDDFINENIGQGVQYFLRDEVKEKIPNILCNVETRLDNIILYIYDTK